MRVAGLRADLSVDLALVEAVHAIAAVWSLRRPGYGNLTTYETYSDLEEVLRRYIDEFMVKMIKACEQVEKAHIDLLPTPFLSAVIDD